MLFESHHFNENFVTYAGFPPSEDSFPVEKQYFIYPTNSQTLDVAVFYILQLESSCPGEGSLHWVEGGERCNRKKGVTCSIVNFWVSSQASQNLQNKVK